MAVIVLCKPGPPMPLVKGIVIALRARRAGAAAGVLMVPVLENYALTGVLLTAALLYGVFYSGARSGQPADDGSRTGLRADPGGRRRGAGAGRHARRDAWRSAFCVGGAGQRRYRTPSFPIRRRPRRSGAGRRAVDRESARWVALRATLIVMPVFVLALTNPSFYLAAIMKTVALGQQAGETNARAAGRELVGSTLMGALIAAGGLVGLSLLAQPVDADAVDDGGRAVGGIARCSASRRTRFGRRSGAMR